MSKHAQQATEFLKNKQQATWHDETLWMVREKRDRMAHGVPEWEELREAASQLKMYSNSHLADLLEEFEQNAIRNGAKHRRNASSMPERWKEKEERISDRHVRYPAGFSN